MKFLPSLRSKNPTRTIRNKLYSSARTNAARPAREICRTCSNWPGGVERGRARKGAVYSNYGVTLLENLTKGRGSELPTVSRREGSPKSIGPPVRGLARECVSRSVRLKIRHPRETAIHRAPGHHFLGPRARLGSIRFLPLDFRYREPLGKKSHEDVRNSREIGCDINRA